MRVQVCVSCVQVYWFGRSLKMAVGCAAAIHNAAPGGLHEAQLLFGGARRIVDHAETAEDDHRLMQFPRGQR